MKGEKKDNVIDMTERIQAPDYRERLRNLKVRLDLEHAKVAVSTSLLSIVILVTLANNNLMTSINPVETQASVEHVVGGRGIASVPNTQGPDTFVAENPALVKDLASRDLSPKASVGRLPSPLESLAFGTLEGRYTVRLHDGHLKEIDFSDASDPKRIEDLGAFLESQRQLLPDFDKLLKIGDSKSASDNVKTYQLVNQVSMPVAKVQFRLDDEGRLLSMSVAAQ